IKIRGHRIELEEIESTLASITGVQAAVVIADPNNADSISLIAFLKVDNHFKEFTSPRTPYDIGKSSLTTYNIQYGRVEEIRRELLERLPSYMIPNEYLVVDTFPKTNNGKIDRKAFPISTYARISKDETELDPTMTETETLILDVWL